MHDFTNIVKNKGLFDADMKVYGFKSIPEISDYISGGAYGRPKRTDPFLFFVREAHYFTHDEGFEHFLIEDYDNPDTHIEKITNNAAMLTGLPQRVYILCKPQKHIKAEQNISLFGRLKFFHSETYTLPYIEIIKYKKL